MTISLQVLYPIGDGISFDHAYYTETHLPLVAKHMGPHMRSIQASKGLSGGGEEPAGFAVIVTMLFENEAALGAAMGAAGPVLEDIPKYYNAAPQMLVGEVLD
ncbi:ethyl tert-butyl ether degradation protein EthD [Actibacterium mucosum KCTC 23349]|uniref:Ethyl tert-butyl ether degradation protein EthD n=1 Tax=Actibacterium mucosum KCTC 23349 TaxID=1454373 RepID=A0A037ZML2_9RHOB|nr:EthD family reductase [Actibacterium mucosum]KAJ56051.1 ethyl tert-butyl ether degradation protein EthD [Actibacterium mucosum KCTC 23349]